MKFIQEKDRNQTEFFCLDQAISEDNEVRLIELFVGAIKLSDIGFKFTLFQFTSNIFFKPLKKVVLNSFIFTKRSVRF